jgi:hypothetical protein
MAIQDDIMAMLSQVSDAGDRATDRGRQGSEMYGRIRSAMQETGRQTVAVRDQKCTAEWLIFCQATTGPRL